jgi:DNA-binding NarL/FixJ family response regulator
MHATILNLHSADIVLADYESGLRLAQTAQAKDTRVVLLTHKQTEVEIWDALERGVRGYLLLGCTVEHLIDNLRSVHGGHIALSPLVASRMANRMTQQILTKREVDILRQVTLGLSNKAIAEKLTVAVGTVKTHVKSILQKLEARSRTEAAAIAQRRGVFRQDSGLIVEQLPTGRSGRANELSMW